MKQLAAAPVLALVLAAIATASRAPNASELNAIEFAVRFFPTISRQNQLSFERVLVSSADRDYAFALVKARDGHGRLIGSLAVILKRGAHWQVFQLGGPPLACSPVPKAVRTDFGATVCSK